MSEQVTCKRCGGSDIISIPAWEQPYVGYIEMEHGCNKCKISLPSTFVERKQEPTQPVDEAELQEAVNGLLRLRKRLCTGPCGQDAATLKRRSDDGKLLAHAIALLARFQITKRW